MSYRIAQLEPYVGEEELQNLKEVIGSKWLTEGVFARKFLGLIRDFTGAPYAVLANNGTLALFLALKAVGLGEGDEVIVPDFTFIASATSIVFAGGKPVFAEVDEGTLNIDTSAIERLITEKTRAIMPVHLYGQSADMDPIRSIAEKYSLKVVEDAAQGYGVFYKGAHVGALGDVGIISFFADKTITTGEGAVILTGSEEVFHNLQYLRNQGRLSSGSFIHPFLGMNFRMTDLQCAVGIAQIGKFRHIEEMKLHNYRCYKTLLGDVSEVKFVGEADYSNLVPFRANIVVEDLPGLVSRLEERGIQTRGFFYPLHRQPCFSFLGYEASAFPVSNRLHEHGLSLPVFPALTTKQIGDICDTIKGFYTERGHRREKIAF